ncbi:MAG: hypothetical protein IJ776_09440 [Paludibacteraceae bacterium]|nr:hypothetical protein [Paludibacteraceae bacterium]
MSNKAAEVICFAFMTLLAIAIIAAAVFLSVHTENYKWMWLLAILPFISIHVESDDEQKKKGD